MDWQSLTIVSSVLVFGSLENIFPFFDFKATFSQRTYPNLILGFFNVTANSLTIGVILHWIWRQKIWLGFLYYIKLPWLSICISFLLLDVYLYIWHRLMHSFAFTWRFHKVHHTEIWMNTSTAYRFHTVEVIPSNIPKLFLVWLFGIEPLHLLAYEMILAIGLIFHHSNWAIPHQLDKLLSYIIVTPNFHRLHHSQILRESQSNYASLFSIWDKIFKSYSYPKYPEKIKLGVTQHSHDLNGLKLILLPFQKPEHG
ncbi:MAG: sterol desaturase family protein [Calothrix sp. C42_A2020_038]|nr:sterol desaturase family protein [Calothrix sp. C42_A2020_038]